MIWFVVIILFFINLALTYFLFNNLVLRVEKCEREIIELNQWFLSKFTEDQLLDCYIKIYDIPDKDVIKKENAEYCFPKTYLPIN